MAFSNVDLFLNRTRNIMNIFGLWLPTNSLTLRKLYMYLIMMTQYCFVLFEFIYIAQVFGDLYEVSDASYLLFTQAAVCCKITVYVVNKSQLKRLLGMMECEIFLPRNKKHEELLIKQSHKIKRLCGFFVVSSIITVTLWSLVPLFDKTERSFPYKIWMPVDPQLSPHYEIGFMCQTLTIYISALLFIGADSTTLCMIMFGCAQLEIIMDKMHQIKPMPFCGKVKIQLNERQKLEEENYKKLVECVTQHQNVIRFIAMLENTYHVNIFFQLSGTVGIICIIGIRITLVEYNSLQFYSMITYMVTMLSQLFLYCWCGNEITDRSQELREVMYRCPWYELGIKFCRCLWITMERMKKPIIFKAGHYIPLSRPTFISILRSSYSYFAVLNQANK